MLKNACPRPALVRAAALLSVAAAGLAAGAQAAEASTIHACVKPKSGATRIVRAKARCHHGEQKLSWNTTGPQGAAGPAGPAGAEGKSGATALFVATPVERFTIPVENGTVVLRKVVPPGSFAVSAKTTIAFKAASSTFADAFCEIIDTPGTTETSEATTLDASAFEAVLGENKVGEFAADSVVTLEASLTSKVTSTLAMGCFDLNATATTAIESKMQALQVSVIG